MQAVRVRFVPILSESSSQRQRELVTSDNRRHAALAVVRRQRKAVDISKRVCFRCATYCSGSCQLLHAGNGNSDPFNCRAVGITPRVNEIVHFYRSHWLPAIYWTSPALDDPGAKLRDAYQKEEFRFGAECLDDQCSAQGFLYAYLTLMSDVSGQLSREASCVHEQALKHLRHRIRGDSDNSVVERTVLMLFTAAVFARDGVAAHIHGKALDRLILDQTNSAAPNIPFVVRALWMDLQWMPLSASSSALNSGLWLPQYIPIFTRPIYHSMGAIADEVAGKLDKRLSYERLRGLAITMRQASMLWFQPLQIALKHSQETFLWLAANLYLTWVRLCAYRDLLQRMKQRTGDLLVDTVLTNTLIYHLNLQMLRPRICGQWLFSNLEWTIVQSLRIAIEEAWLYMSSSCQDVLLWAMFIGGQGAVKAKFEQGRWFSDSFALLARGMTWKDVKVVCDRFLPTEMLQPDGSLWVDEMIGKWQHVM